MIDINTELDNSEGRKIFARFIRNEFDDSKSILEKFDILTKLYFEINAIVNISALRTVDDVYIKHYLDSIYPHKYFSGDCCDVGCGGGFPTIPLAVINKNKITGVDSVGKKLVLIKKSVTELGLKNLDSIYSRSEDLAKLEKRYDTVCARALAETDKALAFCAPLAKDGGKIVLYRTQNQNDKPATDKTLVKYGVSLETIINYVLPETDIKRRLLVYKK